MRGETVNHIGVALRWTYKLAINITVGQESAGLHMHVLVADVIRTRAPATLTTHAKATVRRDKSGYTNTL